MFILKNTIDGVLKTFVDLKKNCNLSITTQAENPYFDKDDKVTDLKEKEKISLIFFFFDFYTFGYD